MEIIETPLNGLYVIQPKVFEDGRGHFFESYNKENLKIIGITTDFVQDNQSLSNHGVLRGLHFQAPNHAQVKLVRVIVGSIMDVVVDIRKDSPTYGKYHSIILSEENKTMFYIPEGFAHGFLVLENKTIVQYKCSDFYNKESESSLLWNDPDININWGVDYEPIVSDKDKIGINFKDFITPF